MAGSNATEFAQRISFDSEGSLLSTWACLAPLRISEQLLVRLSFICHAEERLLEYAVATALLTSVPTTHRPPKPLHGRVRMRDGMRHPNCIADSPARFPSNPDSVEAPRDLPRVT